MSRQVFERTGPSGDGEPIATNSHQQDDDGDFRTFGAVHRSASQPRGSEPRVRVEFGQHSFEGPPPSRRVWDALWVGLAAVIAAVSGAALYQRGVTTGAAVYEQGRRGGSDDTLRGVAAANRIHDYYRKE